MFFVAAGAVAQMMYRHTPAGRDLPPRADDPANPPIFLEGGVFMRGTRERDRSVDPRSPYSTLDEAWVRTAVSPFWIQQHEVTNAEYARFDSTHTYDSDRARHPVVDVTWEEARAYAEWLGGTLPTESQWEFAARGVDSRTYPWGEEKPTCERAQYADCAPRSTVRVMSRPAGATPDGIHDLAGNVWEWVVPDWFDPPRLPINQASRRLRGGSFTDEPFFLRAANRNNDFYAGFRTAAIGFRVAWPTR